MTAYEWVLNSNRLFAFTRDTQHLNEELTHATLLIMPNQMAR